MSNPSQIRRTCKEFQRQDRLGRRAFLRAGSVGFSGLTLSQLLRGEAAGDVQAPGRRNSVILLWMRGGPSHIDMWDPKPDAPVEFRGEFGTASTKVPGIQLTD